MESGEQGSQIEASTRVALCRSFALEPALVMEQLHTVCCALAYESVCRTRAQFVCASGKSCHQVASIIMVTRVPAPNPTDAARLAALTCLAVALRYGAVSHQLRPPTRSRPLV